MKCALIFLFLVAATSCDELADCKCWLGHKPQKEHDGGVKCYGTLLLHTMACNVPERPQCKCSGDVTGILSDSTGIWCTENAKGKELKRWSCENKEEWDKFFKDNPEEKVTV